MLVDHSISTCLARAFAADPWVHFLLGKKAKLLSRRRAYFELMAGQADPASGQNLHSQGHAAAIWRLPDQVLTARPFSVLHAEGRALADLFGADLPRALDAMAILEATHPVEPHVYLAAIGTEPAWRGRGLASDLLGQGLALADAQGLPTYLETTAQDPCLFTKAGFEVLGHVAPLGGPTITRMRRAAKIG